jgi:dUTP pyrophosphatase
METNRKIQFTKIRDVKTPSRANSHDAGTDFFIPEYSKEFLEDLKAKNKNNELGYILEGDDEENPNYTLRIVIPAGEQINIPSGIKVNILDKNTYLEANNKSGIASRYHLVVGASVVDADYQGEVHLNLINTGNTDIEVFSGMKIVQFIHKYYIHTDLEEISVDEYNSLKVSDRGDGNFGHSGIK